LTDEPKTFELKSADQIEANPEVSSRPAEEDTAPDLTAQQPRKVPRPRRVDPDPPTREFDASDVDRLGADLARSLQDGGYYPVVLVGTNYSGKTSLLLSLFSTLVSDPHLSVGITLCEPILGTAGIGKQLHDEAIHTFEIKTQAFIWGEKISATKIQLPYFIPVELRPEGKPIVRFAFLESNGEWYRPLNERNQPIANLQTLYPALRAEIEEFIASYQGGITFLYLLPYTQAEVYSIHDSVVDAEEVQSAALAINGVLRAYDSIRANHRSDDRHLMLVTKWDARSARDPNRAEGIREDDDAVHEFCAAKYGQALATFQGLNLNPDQRKLNAYCAGIINERGLLQLRRDDDVRSAVLAYPMRLWTWLYGNALSANDMPVTSPFYEPPEEPILLKMWKGLLGFVAGR